MASVRKEVAWNKIFSERKIQLGGDYDRILKTQKTHPTSVGNDKYGTTTHCLFQYKSNRALGETNKCQNQAKDWEKIIFMR